MKATVKAGAKGQVHLPANIRKAVGLGPGSRASVEVHDGAVLVRPLPADPISALAGSSRGGLSMLEALIEEHAEEVHRDAEGGA